MSKEELGVIRPKKEEEHIKPKPPLPEDWYKNVDWINLKDKEPDLYTLLFDFLINKMAPCPACVMTTANFPPRSILIETRHPIRGVEYARMRISPGSVVNGAPDPGSMIEVDTVLRIDYYDLVRILLGEIDTIDPIADGSATYIGNMTALLDLKDAIDLAIKGDLSAKVPRPLMWPDGHP